MSPCTRVTDAVELITNTNSNSSLESNGPEPNSQALPTGRRAVTILGIGLLTMLGILLAIIGLLSARYPRPPVRQHVYIVRHGDKYSSYPPCDEFSSANDTLCFDAEKMGNNPPLTPCGLAQAEETANWLIEDSASIGGIQAIVSSPFTRCLETALPLATRLKLSLQVEQQAGEARALEGPFRPNNGALSPVHQKLLDAITTNWDLAYGSSPVVTPEDDPRYWRRVDHLSATIRTRILPKVTNMVIFTHATTSFSLAYGLCYQGLTKDKVLKDFVVAQGAIGPGGTIRVTVDAAAGTCEVGQTNNVAFRCGATGPHKCEFASYPAWYWQHAEGRGPGLCS